jgi:HEAT repeat protein
MRLALTTLMAALIGLIAGYFLFGGQAEPDRMDDASAALIRGLEADLAQHERDISGLRRQLDEQGRARELAQSETARALGELEDARRELAAARAATKPAEGPPRTEEIKREREALIKTIDEGLAEFLANPSAFSINPTRMRELLDELDALGSEGTEKVLSLLNSETAADRIAAAQLLLQMNDPAAIGPLGKAVIDDSDEAAATWASQALIRLDGEGAVNALSKALQESPHEGVRVNALWGLCRHGDDAGIDRSLAFYRDEAQSQAMRDALGQGILALDTPKAMPIADEIARRRADNNHVMSEVVGYYGRIPGPEATQRLLSISQNSDLAAFVRKKAYKLLEGR